MPVHTDVVLSDDYLGSDSSVKAYAFTATTDDDAVAAHVVAIGDTASLALRMRVFKTPNLDDDDELAATDGFVVPPPPLGPYSFPGGQQYAVAFVGDDPVTRSITGGGGSYQVLLIAIDTPGLLTINVAADVTIDGQVYSVNPYASLPGEYYTLGVPMNFPAAGLYSLSIGHGSSGVHDVTVTLELDTATLQPIAADGCALDVPLDAASVYYVVVEADCSDQAGEFVYGHYFDITRTRTE